MKKTLFTRLGIGLVTVLLLIGGVWLSVPHVALGNPSSLLRGCLITSPTALTMTTTTPQYMQAGKATTTLSCDLYNVGSTGGRNIAADSASLALSWSASSTNSKLNLNVEYSNDNIDWYQNDITDNATTTASQDISAIQTYNLSFASTTAGLLAITNNATTTRLIGIRTPTRYVRVVFTVPAGANLASSSALWAELVPKKQTP